MYTGYHTYAYMKWYKHAQNFFQKFSCQWIMSNLTQRCRKFWVEGSLCFITCAQSQLYISTIKLCSNQSFNEYLTLYLKDNIKERYWPVILERWLMSETSGGSAAIFSLTAASLDAECSRSANRFTSSSACQTRQDTPLLYMYFTISIYYLLY